MEVDSKRVQGVNTPNATCNREALPGMSTANYSIANGDSKSKDEEEHKETHVWINAKDRVEGPWRSRSSREDRQGCYNNCARSNLSIRMLRTSMCP